MKKQTKRKNSTKEEYTPEQLKVIRDYEDAVEQKIINFLKKARNEEIVYVSPIVVAKMNDAIADYVFEKTGVDTHGNKIILNRNSIKHIDLEHQAGNAKGKSLMTDTNLSKIGWVLANAEEVVISNEASTATRTKTGKSAPHILLRKRIDGHYYIVEAVSDGKKRNNVIISAFIEERGAERGSVAKMFKEPYRVPNALENSSPSADVQNAHELSSSNNSISNSSKNVNVS